VLGDENGVILGGAVGPSGNVRSTPPEIVHENLKRLIVRVLTETGTPRDQVDSVFLALAGSDLPEARMEIREALAPMFGRSASIETDNDATGALAAGTWGEPGIVLIAGTGSIAYARSARDERTRVGGWGYLLGDEGSGYDIGRKGLAAVMRSYDGRDRETLLTDRLLETFKITDPAEFVPRIYGETNRRTEIAAAARDVFLAAGEGDRAAVEIVRRAVGDLIELAESARASLEVADGLERLVLAGGLFEDAYFKSEWIRMFKRKHPDWEAVHPGLPPVVGAFILALKSAGVSITESIKKSVRESL
jgi:N-acetylglucosamine kinase-like BadF-type ATPase